MKKLAFSLTLIFFGITQVACSDKDKSNVQMPSQPCMDGAAMTATAQVPGGAKPAGAQPCSSYQSLALQLQNSGIAGTTNPLTGAPPVGLVPTGTTTPGTTITKQTGGTVAISKASIQEQAGKVQAALKKLDDEDPDLAAAKEVAAEDTAARSISSTSDPVVVNASGASGDGDGGVK